eukprot:scaffold61427_cov70-Phaeocystis_antarctica.AAC.6
MARPSIALLLLLTVASTAGYKCLFIGHSFFVPISRQLPDLAASAAGVTHEQSEVFSGGASGAPSQMWESDQKRNATQSRRRGSNTRARRSHASLLLCSLADLRYLVPHLVPRRAPQPFSTAETLSYSG